MSREVLLKFSGYTLVQQDSFHSSLMTSDLACSRARMAASRPTVGKSRRILTMNLSRWAACPVNIKKYTSARTRGCPTSEGPLNRQPDQSLKIVYSAAVALAGVASHGMVVRRRA